MHFDLDLDKLVADWTLVDDELALAAKKQGIGRLAFALQLKVYGRHGRFISGSSELSDDVVDYVARQVYVDPAILAGFDWSSRAVRFHRAEIRGHFGFSECSVSDADRAVDWLAEMVCERERLFAVVRDELLAWFRRERIEAPADGRVQRLVRSALHRGEVAVTDRVADRLSAEVRDRLDDLIADFDESIGAVDDRAVAHPCCGRVAIAPASPPRRAAMVAPCDDAGRARTRTRARAGRRVTKELTNAFKKVRGKENILFSIAQAALDAPDDAVRTVVFPAVSGGEKTLKELVHEYKTKGPEYDQTVRATLKASYTGHYRRGLIELLEVLEFRSNNQAHRPAREALALVKRHARAGTRYFPADEDIPIHKGLKGDWKLSVFTTVDGRRRTKRPAYEICMFQALRDQLRCKEIWVVGADKWRNPDDDLPVDFDERRVEHYAALRQPLDPTEFVAVLAAVGITALLRRTPSEPDDAALPRVGRQLAGVGLIALIVVSAFPFWTGNLYNENEGFDDVPSYWDDALDWINAQPEDGRVLVLPGVIRTRYRWGYVNDNLFHGLLDKSLVSHQSIPPPGTPLAADAVLGLDEYLTSPGYEAGTIGSRIADALPR
ncbi:MAG: hypothetical protein ACI9N0_001124 [Ilumatobacter sp.]|jgi:hypothetical protein